MEKTRRGVTMLKMRGSAHDKYIHEFTIDADGMHVGLPIRNVAGILSGHTTPMDAGEMERMDEMFKAHNPGERS